MTAPTVAESLDRLAAALGGLGLRFRVNGHQLSAQCPAHEDGTESLSAKWVAAEPPYVAGRVLVNCFAGCAVADIAAAAGLTLADLFDGKSEAGRPSPASVPRPRQLTARRGSAADIPTRPVGKTRAAAPPGHAHRFDYRRPESRHVYREAAAPDTVIGRVDRLRCLDPECSDIAAKGKPGHTFVTRRPDKSAGKPAGLGRVLYRAPEVADAITAGRPVLLCEGEGDADAVAVAGECGTSLYGGAKPRLTADHRAALAALAGADVIISLDRERLGYVWAAALADHLAALARSVRVVAPAIDREHADISDHLAAGLTLDDVVPIGLDELDRLAAEPTPTPPPEPTPDPSPPSAAPATPHGICQCDRPLVRPSRRELPICPACRLRPAECKCDPVTAAAVIEVPDPDRLPGPPDGADRASWITAETAAGIWGGDDWSTWQLVQGKNPDLPPKWRRILDAAVLFGTERVLAPDPDFPDRTEQYDPAESAEGAADVTVRYRRGADPPQAVEHTVRAMPSSRARDMKALDAAGPSAWLGAKPTPANRATLFTAALALSERRGRPRELIYSVTGHYVIGGEHVLIAGTNALGRAGLRDDLAVATDDRLAPWTWLDPLPASELTDGLAALFALLDAADPRVVVPQVAAVIRAWLGVRRNAADLTAGDEVSPLCWSTGVTGHGKSGVLAAACNLAAPGLRYNVLPFKAGPADTGGITGPALERVLFRCRDMLIPFDDLDPSITAAERVRWQSDLLRRAADQKSRALAQRSGLDMRDSMPPRALIAAGGEPLDGEESALNRALNLPFEPGTVDLSALRDQTTPELRVLRARVGSAVAAGMLADWDGARAGLARRRDDRRQALMPAGTVRGPVMRAIGAVSELAAALDVFLDLAVSAGADPGKCESWRSAGTDALRDALARHLEIIGASTRSARFFDMLRELIAAGGASLDDAEHPGRPPKDARAAGWELAKGALIADPSEVAQDATGELYRRRGAQVGWLADDGSAWLLPSAAVAVAKRLAESAGERWTGSARTVGETLKSDGALIIPPNRAAAHADADLPRALLRAGMGKRAWHVKATAWTDPGDDPAPTSDMVQPLIPDSGAHESALPDDESETFKNAGITGGTGDSAGQSPNRAGDGTGGSGGQPPVTGGSDAKTARPAETRRAATGNGYALGAVYLVTADTGYLGNGDPIAAPDDLADVIEMAAGLGLGAARLHKSGRDFEPHVYLDAAGCGRYGIPAEPPDTRTLALPADHPAAAALRSAGWEVGQVRPTTQVYRRGGPSVALTLIPWLADAGPGLDALTADDPSPASLARRLGTLAESVIPVSWTAGVTAECLMTALRPASRYRKDAQTGTVTRPPIPGSLAGPVAPSPYDAHPNHPAARDRADADECRELALMWVRPRELWTPDELAAPYAVAIDVNLQFLTAAGGLRVGLSAPRPMTGDELAALDDRLAAVAAIADPAERTAAARKSPVIGPGVYVADVAGLDLDPRLPSPLTETGLPPGRPIPLHAPTIRYTLELGGRVTVSAGWVSDDVGPYLDPWNRRLVAAYLAALASAGITPEMTAAEFLAAWPELADRNPDAAAVVKVIKSIAKTGIGRLRQDPDAGPGEKSPADRATWRPDMQAEVIARARTDLHRKIMLSFNRAGLAPLAVSHDAVLYPSDDPSPASVVPLVLNGDELAPIAGGFRIGPRPGWVKHQHTLTMADALGQAAAGLNPAVRRGSDDE